LADLGDTGEVLRYLVGFWAFLLSPRYRDRSLRAWRDSDRNQRLLLLVEGFVATLVGVGVPLLIAWLLAEHLG
jgi:hypothetical protein